MDVLIGLVMLLLQSLNLVSTPTPTATPTPLPSPTATLTPTPTVIPTKPPTKSSPKSTSCASFVGGTSVVTLVLQPNTGTMTGDTVLRIKPTGSCPNESSALEHWLHGNELSWTSPQINSGRYRIEVANGFYQGVISQTVDIVPGHLTFTIPVRNQ